MESLQQIYQQFLNNFPAFLHPFISLAVIALLIYSAVQAIRKNLIYLILLVVLLPASIPILKGVLNVLVSVVKFLLP